MQSIVVLYVVHRFSSVEKFGRILRSTTTFKVRYKFIRSLDRSEVGREEKDRVGGMERRGVEIARLIRLCRNFSCYSSETNKNLMLKY